MELFDRFFDIANGKRAKFEKFLALNLRDEQNQSLKGITLINFPETYFIFLHETYIYILKWKRHLASQTNTICYFSRILFFLSSHGHTHKVNLRKIVCFSDAPIFRRKFQALFYFFTAPQENEIIRPHKEKERWIQHVRLQRVQIWRRGERRETERTNGASLFNFYSRLNKAWLVSLKWLYIQASSEALQVGEMPGELWVKT